MSKALNLSGLIVGWVTELLEALVIDHRSTDQPKVLGDLHL